MSFTFLHIVQFIRADLLTLIETLQIPTLVHKFSEAKLEKFKEYILEETKDCLLKAKIPG